MNIMNKCLASLSVAVLLVAGTAGMAAAQRGHGGFHGGYGGHGGFHGGYHGGFHGGFRDGGFRGGWGYHYYAPAWRPRVYGYGYGYYRPFRYYRPYPRVGVWLNVLPGGYYPFYWGQDQYYYYGGTFYRPYDNGYQVAPPPLGAEVPVLPSGARSIAIDGISYYEYNGVYYQPYTDNNGRTMYQVVGKDGVLNTGRNDQQQQQYNSDNDYMPNDPDRPVDNYEQNGNR